MKTVLVLTLLLIISQQQFFLEEIQKLDAKLKEQLGSVSSELNAVKADIEHELKSMDSNLKIMQNEGNTMGEMQPAISRQLKNDFTKNMVPSPLPFQKEVITPAISKEQNLEETLLLGKQEFNPTFMTLDESLIVNQDVPFMMVRAIPVSIHDLPNIAKMPPFEDKIEVSQELKPIKVNSVMMEQPNIVQDLKQNIQNQQKSIEINQKEEESSDSKELEDKKIVKEEIKEVEEKQKFQRKEYKQKHHGHHSHHGKHGRHERNGKHSKHGGYRKYENTGEMKRLEQKDNHLRVERNGEFQNAKMIKVEREGDNRQANVVQVEVKEMKDLQIQAGMNFQFKSHGQGKN